MSLLCTSRWAQAFGVPGLSGLLLLGLWLWPLLAHATHERPHNLAPDAPRISIGIVADNEPYSAYGAHGPEGFSIDILDEVSRLSGVAFDYRVGSWSDVYGAFLRGDLDAVDEISWREDRAELMLFTRPYHIRQTIVMHDANRPLPPITSLADLRGYRVGALRDIYYTDALRDAGLELTEYSLQPELVRALSFGWIDAIIGAEVTLSYFARELGFVNLQVNAPAPLDGMEHEDFRIAVGRDQTELWQRLDTALAELDPQWVAKVLQRWQEFGGRSLHSRQFKLSPAQQAVLRQQGPLRVGLMRDYAPLSFEDRGQIQGLSVDMLARVIDLTGLRAVPVVGQWSQLIGMFERGEIDVMANMSDLPARRRFARFTEPYHYLSVVGFARSPEIRMTQGADLQGLRVGYGTGIFYEGALREAIGDDAIAFDDQASMFLALESGQVDLVLAALVNGNHWIREFGLNDVYVAGELDLDGVIREDLRFGLRPELAPLVPIFDQALAAISPTEVRVIENRWLGAQLTDPGALPSLELSAQEREFLAARGNRLRYCAHNDWLPLEGVGTRGQHLGIASSLLDLWSDQLNLSFERHATQSWPEALAALRAGACDFLPAAPLNLRDEPDLALTAPYYTLPTVILGRIETPFISALSELDHLPVGITARSGLYGDLRLRHPGMQLAILDREGDGLRRVQSGELYGYVDTLASASHQLQELGLADIRVIGRVPIDTAISMATTAEADILHQVMQKLVASLTPAQRNQLVSEWTTVELRQRMDLTLLWQVLGVTVLTLGLLFYWNRKLRGLNRALAQANASLALASSTDNLTGLGNRTRLEQVFVPTFQACVREHRPFLVAMIDADHFKRINDRWGHAAGDACLRYLADMLARHFNRADEHVIRFGGEEFTIFALIDSAKAAEERLEALRAAIASGSVRHESEEITLTVSIGYCVQPPTPGDRPESWLQAADRALYEAKAQGRNRLHRGVVRSTKG